MTEPLPTLAKIDADLARAGQTRVNVLAAVAVCEAEILDFLVDLDALDQTVDALLELRAQTSRLVPDASR